MVALFSFEFYFLSSQWLTQFLDVHTAKVIPKNFRPGTACCKTNLPVVGSSRIVVKLLELSA
jgi:hypothetical protein